MGDCGCGGASNRYKGGQETTARQTRPAQVITGPPKIFTGRRAAPVNGPKPK